VPEGAVAALAAVRLDPRTSATGKLRWRRPPTWLWGVSVLLQVIGAALLTGYTFFFVDDFLFMEQARTESFGVSYLREPLFEHFSPISRALDTALVELAPGSFVLAHGFELALYAAALIAFALVMSAILGNGWSAFAFTLGFGQSIFLMRLLNWWTATANILPATVFVLLTLACYLRWRERGSWMLLVASFATFALALLDYETAMLFPAYLAVISLLVLERDLGPRGWLATLWRERWAWAGYLALEGVALWNYYTYYYYPAVRPSLGELLHYSAIALFQAFIPSLAGVQYPEGSSGHTPMFVLAAIAVGAIVAVTLYLRPRAWRCLVGFVAVFLISMLPVGLNRIAQFGVEAGRVLYYEQSLQFMSLVLAAFAVSSRWSGRRESSAQRASRLARLRPALLARLRGSLRTRARPSRSAVGVAAAAAIALYATLYVTSVRSMSDASWRPLQASAFVSRYLSSDRQVAAAIGHQPVLVGVQVPKYLLSKHLFPYNSYSEFFALFNSRLRVNDLASRWYVVDESGELLPVVLAPLASGALERASVTVHEGHGAATAADRAHSFACSAAQGGRSTLEVPLSSVQQLGPQGSGLPYALAVRFRMPRRSPVTVGVSAVPGGASHTSVRQVWDGGSGGELIPLRLAGEVGDVDFRLPAGACVTGLELGRLRYAAAD
jgi:hypothetical protein